MSKRKGFTVSVSTSSSSWNSGTLLFPQVNINAGKEYNPITGVFTVPIAREYVFFVNVEGFKTLAICVDILQNGETRVRTLAYTNYNAGHKLVVSTQETD